jgi:hypothetical protein
MKNRLDFLICPIEIENYRAMFLPDTTRDSSRLRPEGAEAIRKVSFRIISHGRENRIGIATQFGRKAYPYRLDGSFVGPKFLRLTFAECSGWRRPQPDLAMAYLLAPKAPFAGSNNAPRSAAS